MTLPRDITGSDPALAPVDVRSTQRDVLERRLEDGYRRIDQAALSGADVTEWESFWITLLGEYEELCRDDELAA